MFQSTIEIISFRGKRLNEILGNFAIIYTVYSKCTYFCYLMKKYKVKTLDKKRLSKGRLYSRIKFYDEQTCNLSFDKSRL